MSDINWKAEWPKRAVVTAGMPYGNKPLHFGHIGGVFIPADIFARFLKDRIGSSNVRFVCGTDCYGSPINEGYRKAVENDGFKGDISDYVMENHIKQAATLKAFNIDLDIYEGSGIGHAGAVHQEVSYAFIESLYKQGHLNLASTMQFYDTQANTFLNGRQVLGKCCPVQGCKAESAYADECSLGHQYSPTDLLMPVSTLTGTTPEMRPVNNWYFDLENFSAFLKSYAAELESNPDVRKIVPQTMVEFLGPAIIYVKNEAYDQYKEIASELPKHAYREAEKGKASFEIEFDSVAERDKAKEVLEKHNIRFRTSKALVPFRITGNIEWGVKAPVIDGVEGLTVWCWPESLWAPISFTIAVNDSFNLPREAWQDFWCAEDSEVFQFIGQDNLYFYGVVQPALWEALGDGGIFENSDSLPLKQTTLVANHHLLFGKTKASSSADVKPPTGEDLLEHYTVEQLRAHFLALGLDQKSVSFAPKPFDPKLTEEQRQDNRVSDPVLKEGALLTNVFNRLARSCFYESKNNFECYMPVGEVSNDVVDRAKKALVEYDQLMRKTELHSIMQLADDFIRYANKEWASRIKDAADAEESTAPNAAEMRRQVLIDSYYLLWVCALMMHPITPKGCELICEHMNFDANEFFSWDHSFNSCIELCPESEVLSGKHKVFELPPKFDFFSKHPSQYK